jgi:hypothetical protein
MSLRQKKTFKESTSDFAESILPALETAVDTARDLAVDAKDKAAPVISDARDKAAPVVAAGAAAAAEKAAEGAALLAEKAAEGRDAVAERTREQRKQAAKAAKKGRKRAAKKAAKARAAAAEQLDLQQERAAVKLAAFQDAAPGEKVSAFSDAEPAKGGKVKKLLFLGLLAGIGAVVFKKLRGGSEADHWQQSYTPAPPPAAQHRATDPVEDAGAASPDEAVSDAAGEPHPDTTPDDPAEVVEIESVDKKG